MDSSFKKIFDQMNTEMLIVKKNFFSHIFLDFTIDMKQFTIKNDF